MFDQPNYTQTPNDLFDIAMKGLNESELKVLLAIVRKTFGWKKERDRISLTQIMELTGLSKPSVLSGIHGKPIVGGGYVLDTGLIQKGYINMFPSELGNEYEVNVNGSKASLPVVVKQVDQQEKLSKETTQKKENTPSLFGEAIAKEPSEAETLAMLLLTEHRKLDGVFARGKDTETIQRWAKDIEKIVRLDERSVEEVRSVILFSQTSDFWCANIASGSKLRKQFDTLLIQSKRLPKSTPLFEKKEEPDDSWRFHDPLAGKLL